MLRTVGPQGSLFELLLPAGMRVLSGELAQIDGLLDDERYFVPFRSFFDPVDGRPSIPIETYLRLMFLNDRYDLGGENQPYGRRSPRRSPEALGSGVVAIAAEGDRETGGDRPRWCVTSGRTATPGRLGPGTTRVALVYGEVVHGRDNHDL